MAVMFSTYSPLMISGLAAWLCLKQTEQNGQPQKVPPIWMRANRPFG
jgi:hypothetical protein